VVCYVFQYLDMDSKSSFSSLDQTIDAKPYDRWRIF
jgi:hypothetical protein